MMVSRFVPAALAFAACVAAHAGQAEPGMGSMERDARCRQFVVTCHVNGCPARLMVDTGATHTVLTAEWAARVQPPLQKLVGVKLSGNAQEAPVPVLVSLQAGGVSMGRVMVLVMDLQAVNALMDKPIDGILGMAQLRHLPFTLDLREGGVGHWGAPARLGGQALRGREDEAGRLYLPARSGESFCLLLLDSGSSVTTWPKGKWTAGAQAAGSLSVADVNGAQVAPSVRGVPAELELAGGLVLPRVSPLLKPGEGGHVLGLDALEGCLLIHRPGQGFFLLRSGQP